MSSLYLRLVQILSYILYTSEYFLYLSVLKSRFDFRFEFKEFDAGFELQEFDSEVEFVMKRVILFSIYGGMKSLFSVSPHLIWKIFEDFQWVYIY